MPWFIEWTCDFCNEGQSRDGPYESQLNAAARADLLRAKHNRPDPPTLRFIRVYESPEKVEAPVGGTGASGDEKDVRTKATLAQAPPAVKPETKPPPRERRLNPGYSGDDPAALRFSLIEVD